MGLRRAACYHRLKRPFTRKSRVKSKAYIKTVPPMKLTKFSMGNAPKYFSGGYNYEISFVSAENAQTRDVSLEAARQFIHRHLDEDIGDYYFVISVYPHHILRENKMLTGAGADRMSTGMALSFGVTTNNAVQLHVNKEIFKIAVMAEDATHKIRGFLNKIRPKLSCKTKIIVSKIDKSKFPSKIAETEAEPEESEEVEAIEAA